MRVVAPSTLLPAGIERLGVDVFTSMRKGLADADVVMMLRLQRERMNAAYVPSVREYFRFWGLDAEKLAWAKPDAIVMHPGPMNRGVEIDPLIADGVQSVIREQVEMGVAVRMAVLEALGSASAEGRRARRMNAPVLFANARVVDPSRGLDARGAVLVADGRIVAAGPEVVNQGAPEGCGDRRLPRRGGASRAWSTCASSSASRAASIARRWRRRAAPPRPAASPTIVTMPDTNPVIDDPALVDFVLPPRARHGGRARAPDGGDDARPRRRGAGRVRPAAGSRRGRLHRGAALAEERQGDAERPHLCARFRRADRPPRRGCGPRRAAAS